MNEFGFTQKINIKWSGNTRNHYESKGYVFTHSGDAFEVDVKNLTNGSTVLVKVRCDFCNDIKEMPYKDYLNLRSRLYCCPQCLSHKKKTKDKKGNLIFVEIPYRNKNWLYNEYIVKNRDARDIAKECGINHRTLREWIFKFNLYKYGSLKEKLDKDTLYELYFVNHFTSEEIGNMYSATGNTIISLLKEYGYKVPTRSELLDIYYNQKGGYEKARKTQSTMENRIKSSCRQRGISIYDFDGFAATEEHMARNNTYYKEWVRKVFERDNYICQCCGKRGGNLNAHHLYNFSERKDIRYDINNGITFCESCHLLGYKNSFHSIYGVRNNSPNQVYEFVNNRNSKQEVS